MTETPEPRSTPDWERIESDYRAGVLSTREIGARHGISHTAINKRAKRDGWARDLAAKIKAKADALVSKEAVSKEVSTATAETERIVVEANAQAIATVRIGHRKDISKARTLVVALLTELETLTGEPLIIEKLEQLLDQVTEGDSEDVAKVIASARETLRKATSLPSRASTMKALADSLKTLVTLEREAWGLESDSTPDPETPSDSFTADQSEAAYARMRG
jgi:hypothetical protein